MIGSRLKTQARGQNKRSIALRLGIVCFDSSNTFEDMIKKKCHYS